MVGLVLNLDLVGRGDGWVGGWMNGWMEDREEGTRLRWNEIRLQLWSHFGMVRVMHAGALDVFRNYHVRYTYIEGRGDIHPP